MSAMVALLLACTGDGWSGGPRDSAETGDVTTRDTSCASSIALSPAEFHFGLEVGQSDQEKVTISNLGCATLNINNLTLADPDQPYALGALGSILLPPDASTTFTVTFAPTEVGEFNTAIHVESNDPDSPITSVLVYGAAIEG